LSTNKVSECRTDPEIETSLEIRLGFTPETEHQTTGNHILYNAAYSTGTNKRS